MNLKPKRDTDKDEYSYWNNMVNFFDNTIPNYFKKLSGDDDPWRGLLIWFKPVFTFFDEFTLPRFVFLIIIVMAISGLVTATIGKNMSSVPAIEQAKKDVKELREKVKVKKKVKKKKGKAIQKTSEYEIYKEETVIIYCWPTTSFNTKKLFFKNSRLRGDLSTAHRSGKFNIKISRMGNTYYHAFESKGERNHVLHIMLKAKEAYINR